MGGHQSSAMPKDEWLTPPELLRALCEAYPNHVSRDALSEATGYARSSRDSYLQRLSARQLVKTDRGTATASPLLFDG